ncbi:MAG: MarR family transcriptional regulator [Chlamydiae bacterium]|nr:MarR family transcriptional regulator [Chlamydiota bacterium]
MQEPFPSEFSEPEESPGFLLWQVSSLWQRRQKKALSKIGLTHVQFVLLAGIGFLESSKTLVTQVGLSKQAKTDVMMTSQVLRTLESKGFLKRKRSTDDPRAYLLSLTKPGRSLMEKGLKIVEAVDRDFFKKVNLKTTNLLSSLQRLSEE